MCACHPFTGTASQQHRQPYGILGVPNTNATPSRPCRQVGRSLQSCTCATLFYTCPIPPAVQRPHSSWYSVIVTRCTTPATMPSFHTCRHRLRDRAFCLLPHSPHSRHHPHMHRSTYAPLPNVGCFWDMRDQPTTTPCACPDIRQPGQPGQPRRHAPPSSPCEPPVACAATNIRTPCPRPSIEQSPEPFGLLVLPRYQAAAAAVACPRRLHHHCCCFGGGLRPNPTA